jgi:hypothetical protein
MKNLNKFLDIIFLIILILISMCLAQHLNLNAVKRQIVIFNKINKQSYKFT